ncbi:MAG TPA: hypothetical protein VK206_19895 [Anaerolineales bacterium]|nr:hypothetical protein [Anaerolineales bacterium]
MAASPLPSASIENEFLRVDYLTTTGPRMIGLYAKGVESNLLAETPDIHWSTPHGEYYLRGGHRLWTAPEDPFYTCPEDHIDVKVEKETVTLISNVDASGLEKEISFCLDKNRVLVTHRVTWHGEEPIELAAWTITQLSLGGIAILPQSAVDGLQPNRNLVFWPYSKVIDTRLELHDDLILIHGRPAEQAFKIGNYNPHGWVAYLFGNALFIKRFSVDTIQKYPDLGCNVEAYVKDACLELETLGPLRVLGPTESVTHEEIWEVILGKYSTRLEDARIISRQLSLK